MSHGLAMFGRNCNLVICNNRFMQLYGLPTCSPWPLTDPSRSDILPMRFLLLGIGCNSFIGAGRIE
jgi:hypothetical protein